MPPLELLQVGEPRALFIPDFELRDWVTTQFLDEEGALYNAAHNHLIAADIGFLWTNVANYKAGQRIAGEAALFRIQGNKWVKGRAEMQLVSWFGQVPDFLITLDARIAATNPSATFCARVDHELYHCAQREIEGEPIFDLDDKPVWELRGHDVEEFVGVAERWGAGSCAGMTAQLVRVAGRRPLIAEASIVAACGNCLR